MTSIKTLSARYLGHEIVKVAVLVVIVVFVVAATLTLFENSFHGCK